MVTVPPRAAPPGLVTSPPAGPAPHYFEGTVGLPSLPAWIKLIPEGALLQGVVQGYTASNTYSVLTAQGTITITSALTLAPGTQLLFQIGPEIAHHRLHLVGGSAPSSARSPAISTTASSAPNTLPPVTVGRTLSALVIRSSPTPPGSPAATTPPASPLATTGVLAQTAAAAYAPGAVTTTASPAFPLPAPAFPLPAPAFPLPAPAFPLPAPTSPLPAPAAPLPAPAAPLPAPAAPLPAPTAPLPAPAAPRIPTTPAFTAFAPDATSPSANPSPASPPAASVFPASPAPNGTPKTNVTPYASSVALSPPRTDPPNPGRAAPAAETAPQPQVISGKHASSEAHSPLYPPSPSQGGEMLRLKVVALTLPSTATETARAASTIGALTPLNLFREGIAALLSPSSDALPPPLPPSVSAPLAPRGLITGTVVANDTQNRPFLAVGSTFLLLESAPLPLGTQVQLTAQPNIPTPTNAPASQIFPTYPSIPALLAAAQEIGGPTEQAIQAMLPRLGPQLAAGMMVFITGAVNGDLRTLVGNNTRATLEKTSRGRTAVAGALQEFEAAGKEARGGVTDWRAITLPILSGHAAITPVHLYLHCVPEEDAERKQEKKEGGQRFLLDINLSQIGSLQIDGLAKHNQLDLVIRTPAPLPPALRDGLRSVFFESVGARGLTGSVTFQTAPRLIPDTGRPHPRSGLIV